MSQGIEMIFCRNKHFILRQEEGLINEFALTVYFS